MAISDLGSLGSIGNKTAGASLAITTSAAASVGNIVIVQVATDNAANTTGATTTHTSIVCGTNTFTKIGEQTIGGGGAAGGVTLSVWRCELTQAIATSATITANFSFSPIAKGMSARRYSKTSAVSYSAASVNTQSGAPTALTVTGLTAADNHLAYRSAGAETKVAALTSATSGWTLGTDVGSTGGGGDQTHVSVMNETLISTGNTSYTSQPGGAAIDGASIMFVMSEAAAVVPSVTVNNATHGHSSDSPTLAMLLNTLTWAGSSAFDSETIGASVGTVSGRTSGSTLSILSVTGPSSGFDPATLFGTSDEGAVFDFSDSANLLQASAGAVVTTGEPVGYAADLSSKAHNATQATEANKPIFYGFPTALGTELITLGTGTAGTGWSWDGTKWTKAAGTASLLSWSISLTPGTMYLATVNMTRTAGTLTGQMTGGTTVSGHSNNSSRSTTMFLIAETGNTAFALSADATFAGTVTRVTVKPVSAASHTGVWGKAGGARRLVTSAINMTASKQATVLVLALQDANLASQQAIDANYTAGGVDGAFRLAPDTVWSARIRETGTTNLPVTASTTAETVGGSFGARVYQWTAFFDRAALAVATQLQLRTRGITPATTQSDTPVVDGQIGNAVISFGAATNGSQPFSGQMVRALVINRTLSGAELADAENWLFSGYVRAAVIGDSTVGRNGTALGQASDVWGVSSFVAGMFTGSADLSYPGDQIADQLADWTALSGKADLDAVFIQIGVNDIRTAVGAGTKTTAQLITELQTLVNTVNTDKPTGCKVYVSQLTPCKTWLQTGGAGDVYQAWLDINEAIAGNGATPITGVDGRITAHVAQLNDGAGDLLDLYDHNGDNVHPSNEGKWIIAQAWRAQLVTDGLLA